MATQERTLRRSWPRIARVGAAVGVLLAALVVWGFMRVTPEVGPAPAFDSVAPSQDELPHWKFGFVGDTHAGLELTDRVFAGLAEHQVEFVLHLGDMVDHGDRPEEWQRLLASAQRHAVRLMPVVGNHDKLPQGADCGRHCIATYFPEIPAPTYRFEHRGLAFLMLNSEQWFSPWTEQGQAVRRELANDRTPTIVCLHRPVFTCSGRDWPRMLLRRLWLHDPLAQGGALAVLAGHNHYYERSRPLDGVTYVVSGGGAKNCYEAGQADGRTAKLVERRNHYGVVEVYRNRLLVRAIDLDGQRLDEFALTLNEPLSNPPTTVARTAGLRGLVQ